MEEKSLICPACRKEMKKLFIEEYQFNIDICVEGCGGIFFDNREFKKIKNNENAINKIKNLLNDKTYPEIEKNTTRICPNCATTMVKNYCDYNKNVEIDDCYNCGGKFLDYGELDKASILTITEEEKNEILNKITGAYSEINKQKGINTPRRKSLTKTLFDAIFKFEQ